MLENYAIMPMDPHARIRFLIKIADGSIVGKSYKEKKNGCREKNKIDPG